MSFDVRIRPDAGRDIEDAARWYESQRRELGHEFLDSVQQTLSRIKENPAAYPMVHKKSRRALIPRLSFGVHYLLVGKTVVIIAVMHGNKNPKRWKVRK